MKIALTREQKPGSPPINTPAGAIDPMMGEFLQCCSGRIYTRATHRGPIRRITPKKHRGPGAKYRKEVRRLQFARQMRERWGSDTQPTSANEVHTV